MHKTVRSGCGTMQHAVFVPAGCLPCLAHTAASGTAGRVHTRPCTILLQYSQFMHHRVLRAQARCWARLRTTWTQQHRRLAATEPCPILAPNISSSALGTKAAVTSSPSLGCIASAMGGPADKQRRSSRQTSGSAGTAADTTSSPEPPVTAVRRRTRTTAQPELDGMNVSEQPTASRPSPPAAHAATAGMTDGAVTGIATAHGVLLHSFGEMEEGVVIKRPSATCRTPYIADVELVRGGSTIMAHTPGLDCAGVVSPGRRVWMTRNAPKAGSKQTSSTHAVQLGQDLREHGQLEYVGAHPAQAERFVAKALELKLLPQLGGYTAVATQQTFGSTRVDFVLSGYADGSRLLLEVKHVTVADYPAGAVPDGVPKGVRTYTSTAQPYVRTALFPHGTGKKAVGVVSDRAIKHLHHLTQLAEAGKDEAGGSVRCAVLFLVNRSDCAAMRPCQQADELFAQMVLRAAEKGVLVLAHDIRWHNHRPHWGKELPVVHGANVTSDIDEEHLERVLHFNATDPRPRWKSHRAAAAAAGGAGRGGGNNAADASSADNLPAAGYTESPGAVSNEAAGSPAVRGSAKKRRQSQRSVARAAPAAEHSVSVQTSEAPAKRPRTKSRST